VKTSVVGDVLVVTVVGAIAAVVTVVAVVVVAAAVVVGVVNGRAPSTVGSVVNTGAGVETVAAVLVVGASVVASSGDFAARLASSEDAQPAEASTARATMKKARLSTGKSR
jgi:hypothetical protein